MKIHPQPFELFCQQAHRQTAVKTEPPPKVVEVKILKLLLNGVQCHRQYHQSRLQLIINS